MCLQEAKQILSIVLTTQQDSFSLDTHRVLKKKSYLKFTCQNESRSPLHSTKLDLELKKKIFLKQFQYRCSSEVNFSCRENAPQLAYVLRWFGQRQLLLHGCLLFRSQTLMHLKTSVLRTYFQKCSPEGQQPRES